MYALSTYARRFCTRFYGKPKNVTEIISEHQTVFIFTSPQAIVNRNHTLRNYLFTDKLIHFIVVDEIHLVNRFGKTFREEFGAMKEKIFASMKN